MEMNHSVFKDVKKYLSVEDMAFAENIHNSLKNLEQFQELLSNGSVLVHLFSGTVDECLSFQKQVGAFAKAESSISEARSFLNMNSNGGDHITNLDNSFCDNEKQYVLHKLGDVILVGVKGGFLEQMSKKENLLSFYIDSLEKCSYSLQGQEVRSSQLYAQFVKLSLSI